MTAMLLYALMLVVGFVVGSLMKTRVTGTHKYLLSASIILLLFFMGVGVGKDPAIGSKIARFGVVSITITIFSVACSVFFVAVIMKFFRARRGA